MEDKLSNVYCEGSAICFLRQVGQMFVAVTVIFIMIYSSPSVSMMSKYPYVVGINLKITSIQCFIDP